MKTLFIQGPEKTATSTITGILNCHPEIFILFENYLSQPMITKYGNQLLDRYPEARHFFRSENDYGKPIQDFFSFLYEKEPKYKYKYVGTKINSLDSEVTQQVSKYPVIFTMRDLKSWLVKESVIKRYRTDLDVIIPTVEYLKYIIGSAQYSHAYRLRLEDLIRNNEQTIKEISDYLGLSLSPHTDDWWKKIGYRDEEDPKSVFKLNHVHPSSNVKPDKLDTEVEIMDHPFWSDVNSIIPKYLQSSGKPNFDKNMLMSDLEKVEDIKKYAPLPFSECYSQLQSVRLGFKNSREIHFLSDKNREGKKRSIVQRVINRLKRIKNAAFNDSKNFQKWLVPALFYDEAHMVIDLILFIN